MITEEYIGSVTEFEFQLMGYIGFKRIIMKKSGDKFKAEYECLNYNQPADDAPSEISEDKWHLFFSKLFDECGVMDYPEEFTTTSGILDGGSWQLHLEFGNGSEKEVHGYMSYPGNWKTLMETICLIDNSFRKYI